ncbi:ATP-dependent protease LonB [Thermococcus sp. GR7]|uniref:ATP-dependent protease LonB n=1 Tax=unclassified Thermococcus TaxID=2627626 RepID=UPI0014315684|nr:MULTISPECIES: ATP-dependent protease LonB [unclassified Thermococcus]NJE46516.1 ATP-dependent protease LonB [Thermococcus sp. GR7]NJE77564.1 ATP-dependent protease LonB [Thermococcus sp. GR4]NJF23653.1 ATP-dependent protease LonB [Thermococcus sp. GR5]
MGDDEKIKREALAPREYGESLELGIEFTTTEEIEVPEKLIDQVIGQEHAVEVIKTAANQKRHVLLIGEPGTGKSMLGQAMAELLPTETLEDILVFPNPEDENMPRIKTVPACQGRRIVEKYREKAKSQESVKSYILLFVMFTVMLALFIEFSATTLLMGLFVVILTIMALSNMRLKSTVLVPKLLVDNCGRTKAPFIDATGAHAGALLGDVRHDPFQSGGLGTPAHERVEPGMIHRAHKGVLFIDEIATLSLKMQQSLLTAMQEKKFPITGQSEMSSGAMVRTEPVPCDFVLVAAGNLDTVDKMHPALRSRIRGYGYEVYMRTTMPDTIENRRKLVQFVAQEVKRDGKIPHFTKEAVEEIVREAQKRAGRKGHLTLRLRDLGGIVRAAGDIAVKKGKKYVEREDVIEAVKMAKPLEKQLADWYIERKKEYQVIKTEGSEIGRVNGLAVIGEQSGIVLPIEAVVAPAASKEEGKIIVTGKLGEIAKEAVQNVSAIIKRYKGEDISRYDIHVQFLQTYEGVEGDSASISVATAVISALEEIPIRQDVAMTGSLSVRGEVLPIGGATPKIEAAIEAGIKTVIIPKSNEKDVFLSKDKAEKIQIFPVETIDEVLEIALEESEKKRELLRRIRETLPLSL